MKRVRKFLSALLVSSSILTMAACGGATANPVVILQLSSVPQNVVHIVLDVSVPTSVSIGHATFTRDTTNSYAVGRVPGLMPPGPANSTATLALDLPTGSAGSSIIAVKAETVPMNMQMGVMPMPMESAWACARVNVIDGQINTIAAAFTTTQMACK